MRRGPFLAVAALLLSAFAAPENFFAQAPGADPDRAAFREDWLGQPLRAMGEPAFARLRTGADHLLQLRLLVRPALERPYVIRIDERADGQARLSIARLDGHSRHRPGRAVRQPERSLSPARLAAIHAVLPRADLPAQPVQGRDRPPRMVNGEQELLVCVHATIFSFELADATGLYQIDRNPCTLTPPLAALAEAMLRLYADAPKDDHAILAEAMGRD